MWFELADVELFRCRDGYTIEKSLGFGEPVPHGEVEADIYLSRFATYAEVAAYRAGLEDATCGDSVVMEYRGLKDRKGNVAWVVMVQFDDSDTHQVIYRN